MPEKSVNKDELSLSYSSRAKSLFRAAERHFKRFEYPLCIYFSQESIEFSLKSILEIYEISYKPNHEISEYLFQLYKKLPDHAHKQLGNSMLISVKWLGKLRNYVRYGFQIQKIPPENLVFFNEDGAKQALQDAEYLMNFLISIEFLERKTKRIGILNGYVFGTEKKEFQLNKPLHNNIKIDEYFNYFKGLTDNGKNLYEIEFINASKIGNNYDIIINPFGEIYPEIDLINLYIFNKIRDFIQNGGLFVNLGGFAFYYAHNVIDGKTLDIIKEGLVAFPKLDQNKKQLTNTHGQPLFELMKIKPFETTLLWNYFNVQTTSDNIEPGINGPQDLEIFQTKEDIEIIKDLVNLDKNKVVKEYRAVKKLDKHIIPLIRASRKEFKEVYPLSVVQYYLGYLFLASMSIQSESEFKRIVNAIHNFMIWKKENIKFL